MRVSPLPRASLPCSPVPSLSSGGPRSGSAPSRPAPSRPARLALALLLTGLGAGWQQGAAQTANLQTANLQALAVPALPVAASPASPGLPTSLLSSLSSLNLIPIGSERLEVLGVAPDAQAGAPGAPGGGLLAVRGAGSNAVQLYDAVSGQLRRTVRLPPEVLVNVPPAISPDGRWLAVAIQTDAATGEGRIGLLSTTDPVYRFFLKSAGLSGTTALAFSPDGTRLAAGNRNGYAQLWNLDTRERLSTVKGQGPPLSLEFSPDGKLFLPRFPGQKGSTLVSVSGGQPLAVLVDGAGTLAVPGLLVGAGGRALALPSGTPTPLPAYLAGGAVLAGFDRSRSRALVQLPVGPEWLALELRDVLTGRALGQWVLPAAFATAPRLLPSGQHALIGDGAGGLRLLTLR